MIVGRVLPHTLTRWDVVGVDGYGRPTWAAPVVIRCIWIDGMKRVINANGEEVTASASIIVADEYDAWPERCMVAKGEYADAVPVDGAREPIRVESRVNALSGAHDGVQVFV